MNLIKTTKVLGAVLVAATLIFTACTKGRQAVFTETENGTTRLYITDKRGQGKTDITPALTGGYKLSGSAQFSSRNKQRIIVRSFKEQEPTIAYFSCNLKGRDVTEIRTFTSEEDDKISIEDIR